jgi:uncharacterized RDD family membrane protein YckC
VIRLRGFAYCALCKGEQVRDIQSGSVKGELELATLGRRFGAIWIDSLSFMAVFVIGGLVLGLALATTAPASPNVGGALNLFLIVMAFVVAFVYEGVMLQVRGQTLGKMAVGIKVVGPDGAEISPGQAWGRSLIRNLFNYFAIVDYLPAAFTKQRTCIHDLIAKTRVVRVRK